MAIFQLMSTTEMVFNAIFFTLSLVLAVAWTWVIVETALWAIPAAFRTCFYTGAPWKLFFRQIARLAGVSILGWLASFAWTHTESISWVEPHFSPRSIQAGLLTGVIIFTAVLIASERVRGDLKFDASRSFRRTHA